MREACWEEQDNGIGLGGDPSKDLGRSPRGKKSLDSDNKFRWQRELSNLATTKPTDPSGTYNYNPTILPDKP